MRIQTNIESLNAYRNLSETNRQQSQHMERLSSGFRINRAADDAAGLSISEQMRGQIGGLDQATENAQDATSLIQTAEGALNESHEILQRMRELSVQAANDTLTEQDRGEIQREMDQLAAELTRIGETTEFNTQELLEGSFEDNIFHIGANEGQNIDMDISDMRANALDVVSDIEALGVELDNIDGFNTQDVEQYYDVTGDYTARQIDGLDGLDDTDGELGTLADGDIDAEFNVVEVEDGVEIGDTTYDYALEGREDGEADDGQIYAVSEDGDTWSELDTERTSIEDIEDGDLDDGGEVSFGGEVTSGIVHLDGDDGADLSGASMQGVELDGVDTDEVWGAEWDHNVDNDLTIYANPDDPETESVTLSTDGLNADETLTINENDPFEVDDSGISGDVTTDIDNVDWETESVTWDISQYDGDIVEDEDGNLVIEGAEEFTEVTVEDGETTITFEADAYADQNSWIEGGTNYTLSFDDVAAEEGDTLDVTANVDEDGDIESFDASIIDSADEESFENLGLEPGEFEAVEDEEYGSIIEDDDGVMIAQFDEEEGAYFAVEEEDGEMVMTDEEVLNPDDDRALVDGTLLEVGGTDVETQEAADAAISTIDEAITSVSEQRGELGAVQNRLEHTVSNLEVASENLQAAESRIRDTDMAAEMTDFTTTQILEEAGTAMLAQANQAPQNVLQLLG
ncbi:flagellin [Halarsenatibacter silvermanii]|uniref:Flagellin n=1 Tax=Halarsenatibacter silvermanii TaxID=321763 RepID=A0A1G9M0Q4_9FIRM|nr:flagellin [Halarsenatibacter silvermanii]SDL67829.1 flagellin [Halarsenatibacter silvermanii]